jgi:uncharacterized protein HemY
MRWSQKENSMGRIGIPSIVIIVIIVLVVLYFTGNI